MYKAYKYRIYPTKEQAAKFDQHFGCCRLVWNLALSVKIDAYKSAGKTVSRFDLEKQLLDLKNEFTFLKEVSYESLSNTLLNLDNGYKKFFNGGGFPKFKNKHSAQSFQSRQSNKLNNNLLSISKIKNIPIIVSRQLNGVIKKVTISRVSTDKYFASILVDTGLNVPVKAPIDECKTIGIDLGIKDFAILSDGTKIDNPRHLHNNLKRLKCLQRRVSRKKKGSKNRKKAVKKLAIQHERITNMRKDFLQKLSTKIVCDNQATTFCIENLSVNNMVKNHKLAQAINDVGWGEFVRQLEYKCNWYGKNLIRIGRFEPSSKTCNECGIINELLTLKDREWVCANCSTLHDRDINAAINIKKFGLKNSGWVTPGGPVELLPIGRA